MASRSDTELELIQAIQQDPDDDAARMVYADWLDQQGDLRGEFLRLELQLRRIPPRLAELERLLDPSWIDQVGVRNQVVLRSTDQPIATIKVIRSITQVSLKDAKDLYDRARATGRAVIAANLDREAARSIANAFQGVAVVEIERYVREPGAPPVLTIPLVITQVRHERRLDAIVLVRELTGTSLIEAKRLIDEVSAGRPAAIRLAAAPASAAAAAARFEGIAEVRIDPPTR